MKYESWLELMNLNNPPSSWNRHGDRALATPLDALLPNDAQLVDIASQYPLPEAQRRQLLAMRGKVEAEPLLSGLYQIWHTIFFVEKDASEEAYEPWPVPASLSESDASLFRALVILSGTQTMTQTLHERGLSDYRQACLKDYLDNTRKHDDLHGVYGLASNSMWWLWPVFLGRVFRLGRLNYEIGFYSSPHMVFQHRDGHLLLLAGDVEQAYDESGHEAETGPFQPVYQETETQVFGNAFSSQGKYIPKTTSLDLSEWSHAVVRGDPVISLHIPPEGRLDPHAVQESLHHAVSFFEQHFPDLNFRLFICHSWLLNTELSALLPVASNILAFQSLFTIALANKDTEALYAFIFGVPPCPVEQLVPKTAFHERILSFIREGGILWDGFGVFPFRNRPDHTGTETR